MNLTTLRQTNAKRWADAKLTRASEYTTPVKRIIAAKDRYIAIQASTGVHWVFIACTHYRESNLDFSKSLAQGDPYDRVSTHVPKGRGPFRSFEDAAVDALVNCAPYAAKNTDWSMPDLLTLLEQYNGLGYANRNLPSPYVWSGTDQYQRGKYVADGRFDPSVVDKQLGVAGLIISLQSADPTIVFPEAGRPVQRVPETAATVVAPKPNPTPESPVAKPEGPSVASTVWTWLKEH